MSYLGVELSAHLTVIWFVLNIVIFLCEVYDEMMATTSICSGFSPLYFLKVPIV